MRAVFLALMSSINATGAFAWLKVDPADRVGCLECVFGRCAP
jgi:hypothetical protein